MKGNQEPGGAAVSRSASWARAPLRRRFADRLRVTALPGEVPSGLRVLDDLIAVIFVRSGTGWVGHGTAKFRMSGPEAFVVAPGERFDLTGLATVVGWEIEVPVSLLGIDHHAHGCDPGAGHPHWLSFIRPACLNQRFELSDETARRWDDLGKRMVGEAAARPPGYTQILLASATTLLVDLARLTFRPAETEHEHAQPLVAAAFDTIERRYREPIGLAQVAAGVSVSPGHLARVMKSTTTRTVNDWILQRRMREARRLLLTTSEKVERIAEQCGFSDAGYFRRRFRVAHEMSPSEWRRATIDDQQDADHDVP